MCLESMRTLIIALLFTAPAVQAQIYHCDTPQGRVYADAPCGEEARVIELAAQSSGISMGPPQAVRDDLAKKREQRAVERQARREAQANRPEVAPQPVAVAEPPVSYPVVWPRRHRPHRPRPPDRPSRPPPETGSSGNVLRPRGQ